MKIRKVLRKGQAGTEKAGVGAEGVHVRSQKAAVGMSILSPFLLTLPVFCQEPDQTSSRVKKAEQREEGETTHRLKVGESSICSWEPSLQGSC